ncbi:hypothetical protein [Hymenobacter coccineus]|uniref:Uncharacterized protein n=1 Tax=Hymenobacter coccineus TaxID=1908235 RepID=A0A1G1SXJ0_9BACT|nr:hypothetical protein [Hymenobacter coccineus]OGX83314.1 hypothetical protein BEN49_12530 [Hymenobacter coccineus]
MKKRTSALLLLATALAVGLLWLLTSRAATPDAYPAVAGALRQARPDDVESITCYPLLPDRRGRPGRFSCARPPLLPRCCGRCGSCGPWRLTNRPLARW